MVDFNPNFPEVLGLEWLMTHDQKSRVWAGSPGRMQRLRSTTAETITALKMSTAVDPLLRADVPTLVDVVVEGDELVPLPTLARLVPSADGTNDGWVTQSGGTTNLFQSIDDDPTLWPQPEGHPLVSEWIEATTPALTYNTAVDASLFDTGGAAENGRICWVAAEVAMSAGNPGFSRVECKLNIGGDFYAPAGGAVRDVHSFGAIYAFWWGEINPATLLPWTPADIAGFGASGTSRIRFRASPGTSAARFPRVHAARLNVSHLTTENRAAVGVWNRPIDMTDRLTNIETDSLITVPSGAANWSKLIDTNYLFFWRQSVSPSQYGAIVADDVRWNGGFQQLGPAGQPPNIVYPLHHSGEAPPPATGLASALVTYDQYGRPQEPFDASSRASYALALLRSDVTDSADSQPYRLDLADLVLFGAATGITGQRLTPASSQTYVGVRLPIIPSPVDTTLTVTVHRVSDGTQIGGSLVVSTADVRAIPASPEGVRYLSDFFSSPVALVGATQYEVRLTASPAPLDRWIAFAPDCSLAPSASFGGSTDGAMIDGTHQTGRDMCVNLIRQPDPPQNLTATLVDVPVTTYAVAQVPTVQHVALTWQAPAGGVGAVFRRYEVERQVDAGPWQRVANVNNSATLAFIDHEAPRASISSYRIRAVHRDGRISAWEESNPVTPTATGQVLILTSNHAPASEVVYLYDKESSYPILSDERDETISIHGADYQAVFMETEDRGVGWHVEATINQISLSGKGGQAVLAPLLSLVRSLEVPYVCVLDHEGTQILGHVSVTGVTRRQPAHRYTAPMDVVPTHVEPIPVEVP